jgi:predicted DNA-binding transcriptional regulator YafY
LVKAFQAAGMKVLLVSGGFTFFTDHVRDRFWHESQEILDLPDGQLELTLQLADLLEAERLILQWGGQAEALEPGELRARLAAAGKAIARTHG